MPYAVERDVRSSHCSEVQSELRSGKARPPTKELFDNISHMTRETIPGRK